MIITLSPAKIQDFESVAPIKEGTKPLYEKEADELYKSLDGISVEEISSLMNVNKQIAYEVHQYIKAFPLERTPQKQAIFAYNGIAYQGLDAKTMNKKDLEFAQNHLIHISGLYGVLRPLDMIKPYRLEMQIGLVNNKGKNLYDFWTETISKYIAKRLIADDNIWVNLSSKEYTKVVSKKLLPTNTKIITPIFKNNNGKGYKQIVVYAKKARGMMARYIIQNQLTKPDDIKSFDVEGYYYSPQHSTDSEWVFIR